MNNVDQILNQIHDLLIRLNFKEFSINGNINYVFDSIYCIPQYVETLGFLVEYADSLEEAQKNFHGDGDSFPLGMGADAILAGIEEEILLEISRKSNIK